MNSSSACPANSGVWVCLGPPAKANNAHDIAERILEHVVVGWINYVSVAPLGHFHG